MQPICNCFNMLSTKKQGNKSLDIIRLKGICDTQTAGKRQVRSRVKIAGGIFMVIVQIYITVKKEHVQDFIRYTKDNVSNSNREPGVKRFECFRDTDYDNRFMLFEMFNSVEDQNSHRETDHYKRWKENTADLLESPYTRSSLEYI